MTMAPPQPAALSTLAVLRTVRDWTRGEDGQDRDPVTLLCDRCDARLADAVAAFHRAWTAGLIGFEGSFARAWLTPLGAAALAG